MATTLRGCVQLVARYRCAASPSTPPPHEFTEASCAARNIVPGFQCDSEHRFARIGAITTSAHHGGVSSNQYPSVRRTVPFAGSLSRRTVLSYNYDQDLHDLLMWELRAGNS